MKTTPETDELAAYLAALDRDRSWRVDAVLRDGRYERTELVSFEGRGGAALGPFVRKTLDAEAGLGSVYERVFEAQRRGVRLAHLPHLLDCHREGGRIAVVMEYVEGATLAERVEALGAGDGAAGARLALVRRVFPDLCDAVGELHGRLDPPVIHRDLKPSNVIVGEAGVTLIDLGIAREFKGGAERDTVRFGTRAYAPPEQFGFGETDVRSDVYALGMILFFCLAGREAAQADRRAGFRAPGVPEGLASVVARAAELDPRRRFASAALLRDAFLAAAGECGEGPSGFDAGNGGEGTAPGSEAVPFPVPAPPAAAGPSRRAALSRVPEKWGLVWDVLLALTTVLMLLACVASAFDPPAESAGYPFWYRFVTYVILMGPLFVVSSYAVSDRRPLRRVFPRLRGLSLKRDLQRCAAVLAALTVALAAVAAVFDAASGA